LQKKTKITPDCTDTSTIQECTISGNDLIRGLNEAAMSFIWGKDNRHCAQSDKDYKNYMSLPIERRFYFDSTACMNNWCNAKQSVNLLSKLGSDLLEETGPKMFIPVSVQADTDNDPPLWYRGWSLSMLKNTFNAVKYSKTLTKLKVQRMVVGHHVMPNGITVFDSGRFIGIDVGQSYAYGEHAKGLSLLKIEYDGSQAKKISSLEWKISDLKTDPKPKLRWEQVG